MNSDEAEEPSAVGTRLHREQVGMLQSRLIKFMQWRDWGCPDDLNVISGVRERKRRVPAFTAPNMLRRPKFLITLQPL